MERRRNLLSSGLFACAALALLGGVPVHAIQLLPAPDLMGSGLTVSYVGTNFSATGLADSFTVEVSGVPTLYPIDSGSFNLTATISGAGVASAGQLNITGCIPGMAGAPGCSGGNLLLAGNLNYFAFVHSGESHPGQVRRS